MEDSLARARKAERASAAQLEAWARVIGEARGLARAVGQAVAARAATGDSDSCDSPAQRSLWVAVRGLVGPAALTTGLVSAYARGLTRLRAELEKHAALPPAR